MAYDWKRAPVRDATGGELRRLRLAAERYLRRGRARVPLRDVDAFLWSYWYRLRDDVCERLGAIVTGRATRRARARGRAR